MAEKETEKIKSLSDPESRSPDNNYHNIITAENGRILLLSTTGGKTLVGGHLTNYSSTNKR